MSCIAAAVGAVVGAVVGAAVGAAAGGVGDVVGGGAAGGTAAAAGTAAAGTAAGAAAEGNGCGESGPSQWRQFRRPTLKLSCSIPNKEIPLMTTGSVYRTAYCRLVRLLLLVDSCNPQ